MINCLAVQTYGGGSEVHGKASSTSTRSLNPLHVVINTLLNSIVDCGCGWQPLMVVTSIMAYESNGSCTQPSKELLQNINYKNKESIVRFFYGSVLECVRLLYYLSSLTFHFL